MPPEATAAPATDLDSAIDALPVITEVPETGTTDNATAPEALETPGQEPAAAPAEATAERPAEPEELDPADPLDADKVSPDGKTYFFRKTKAEALLAARDFTRQVQQIVPNATPDMIRENFERVTGLDAMLADYDSGDPARVSQAADAFLSTAQNPQSVGLFADHVVATVARTQPQVFAQIEAKVTNGLISRMYEEATRTGDQNLLKLAQNLDFKHTGKFRDAQQLAQRDPLESERAKLERERSDFYNLRQQEARQRAEAVVQEATNAVDSAVQQAIAAAVPKAVADGLKAMPDGGEKLNLIALALNKAVEDWKTSNPIFTRQFQLAVDRYRANPTANGRQALVTMMQQAITPIINQKRNAVIKAVVGTALSENAATHAKQQQLAARTEPGGVNAPTQRAGVRQQLADIKKRGGNFDEAFDLVFGR
jgi:hypothetical protein